MNVIELHTRATAFWSAEMHRKYDGATTVQGYARFKLEKVNWLGPSIGGHPGVVQDGQIVRPEGFDTYRLIGPFDEQEYFFTTLDAALPAHVFAVEEERRAKVLAERDLEQMQYEANVRSCLERPAPRFDHHAMLRTAIETGERLMKRSERAAALHESTSPPSTESPLRRGQSPVTSAHPDTSTSVLCIWKQASQSVVSPMPKEASKPNRGLASAHSGGSNVSTISGHPASRNFGQTASGSTRLPRPLSFEEAQARFLEIRKDARSQWDAKAPMDPTLALIRMGLIPRAFKP